MQARYHHSISIVPTHKACQLASNPPSVLKLQPSLLPPISEEVDGRVDYDAIASDQAYVNNMYSATATKCR